MKKKILAMLLTLSMSAALLSGCGTTTTGDSSSKSDSSASSTDSSKKDSSAGTDSSAKDSSASSDSSKKDSSTGTDSSKKDSSAADSGSTDLSKKTVGVCIYQFSDNFMTLFRDELQSHLVSLGFSKDNITIVDGANDQATQTGQIDNFISQGVDVLIINPVNSSSTETITDKVVAANIPLVYINREPDDAEKARWEENKWDVTYVGCDARQSGTFQGELIADLGLDTVDLNKNGKVDYVMVEGDPENIDARYRTEYSIKALEDSGLPTNELTSQVGNWMQDQAQQIVANALGQYGNDVEVVFCNNDAMALGALQAIDAAGRKVGKDIFLVGVDALSEALENVIAGTMTGTVFNDHFAQSHASAEAAINYISGKGNEHYIGCDYVKVTDKNAQEILDSVK